MAEQDEREHGDVGQEEKRLTRWVRFYSLAYRIILTAGLLMVVAAAVVLLVTELFTAWILLVPAALITLGLILARVEYRLDMRLYGLQNPASDAGDKSQ